jgi:hypothetical protein
MGRNMPEQHLSKEWWLDALPRNKRIEVAHRDGNTFMRVLSAGSQPTVTIERDPAGPVIGEPLVLIGSLAMKADIEIEHVKEGKLIQGECLAFCPYKVESSSQAPIQLVSPQLFVPRRSIEDVTVH